MSNNQITLNINGSKIIFNVDETAHERLIDEMQPNAKVVPMHNFLMRTVTPETKAALEPLIEHPASVVDIATHVVGQFTPKLRITLGE